MSARPSQLISKSCTFWNHIQIHFSFRTKIRRLRPNFRGREFKCATVLSGNQFWNPKENIGSVHVNLIRTSKNCFAGTLPTLLSTAKSQTFAQNFYNKTSFKVTDSIYFLNIFRYCRGWKKNVFRMNLFSKILSKFSFIENFILLMMNSKQILGRVFGSTLSRSFLGVQTSVHG